MSNTDVVALNPQIVGQLEKLHQALLKKVLAGTQLDEEQWITLQVALGSGGTIGRPELVGRVSGAARYESATVEAAIAALTSASLIEEVPGRGDQLAVSPQGRELVASLRAKIAELVGPAYGSVAKGDLVTAAKVVIAITTRLAEVLARA
jgi:DNA-binding MarR family transcriptional regulator